MSGCCDPSGYRHLFNTREARRRLATYEKKGLDSMAQKLVDHLVDDGVVGSSVLEVGGGIGGLHIDLVAAGAVSATNVEISDAYEPFAAQLLDERGLTSVVDRRVGDFTDLAHDLSADVVVMNRVVCCYPFMERLMNAAASSARRVLALTYPRSNVASRVFSSLGNAYCRIRNVDFQSYVHDPEAIVATAESHGLAVVHQDSNLIWHGTVLRRAA